MRDIELAGFVVTAEEWASMDPTQRAQLLRASLRTEPWFPPAPPLPSAVVAPDARLAPRTAPGRPLLPADAPAPDRGADHAPPDPIADGWYAAYELID